MSTTDSSSFSVVITGTPSWIPPAGQWAAVGLNTLTDVRGPVPATGSTFNDFLDTWSGSAYAPGYGGLYGSLIYGPGGGHASYDGSDVYAYDIETRQCSLVKATYNPTNRNMTSDGAYPDGSPLPPHNYCGLAVLPLIGSKGSLFLSNNYLDNQYSPNNPGGRQYVSFLLDLNSKVWSRGPNTVDSAYTCSAVAQDGTIWFQGAITSKLQKYNGTTLTRYTNNGPAREIYGGATIDTTRSRFLWFDGQQKKMFVTDMGNPNVSPTSYTFGSGPDGHHSLNYSPSLDKIIGYSGGKTVWTMDASNISGGWISQGAGSSVTPPNPVNGVHTKYRWIEAIGCMVGISTVTSVAYAYKLV